MKTMYSTHSRASTPVKVLIVGEVVKHGITYKQTVAGKLYRAEWLEEAAAAAYRAINQAKKERKKKATNGNEKLEV